MRLWCRARSGSTGFRRRFRKRCGRLWCRVRFNRVPEKVLEKVPEKVPGGFGAEPGQVKVPEKVWEALVQSQVRFNRVPEKVMEKVPGGFGAEPGQVKVPEKVWEALVQSQVRFNRVCRHLIHGSPAEVFPALGFAAHFRKTCKNKALRLLGISPIFFFWRGVFLACRRVVFSSKQQWL